MAVSIFKDEYIVRVYQLARSGMTEKKISKILGISLATFRVWERKKKYFKLMLEAGRKAWGGKNEKEITIQDYIFKSLPKNLRKLWNEINALERAKSWKKCALFSSRLSANWTGERGKSSPFGLCDARQPNR